MCSIKSRKAYLWACTDTSLALLFIILIKWNKNIVIFEIRFSVFVQWIVASAITLFVEVQNASILIYIYNNNIINKIKMYFVYSTIVSSQNSFLNPMPRTIVSHSCNIETLHRDVWMNNKCLCKKKKLNKNPLAEHWALNRIMMMPWMIWKKKINLMRL